MNRTLTTNECSRRECLRLMTRVSPDGHEVRKFLKVGDGRGDPCY